METSSIHLVNHSHSTRSLKNSVQAPILSEYVDYRAYLSLFIFTRKEAIRGYVLIRILSFLQLRILSLRTI